MSVQTINLMDVTELSREVEEDAPDVSSAEGTGTWTVDEEDAPDISSATGTSTVVDSSPVTHSTDPSDDTISGNQNSFGCNSISGWLATAVNISSSSTSVPSLDNITRNWVASVMPSFPAPRT